MWSLFLSLLPVIEFSEAKSIAGEVSLVQCGYFFFSDLEKLFTVILGHQVLG
jgi:hypothetical protein